MTAVVAIVVLLVLALLLFAANYFFRYTFLRADKPDPWNDGLGELVLKDRSFFERPDRELLEIAARDGLRLKAWFYDQGGDVTVILCHGYRGGPEELSGIASHLYTEGMNILLIYQRAHGVSEGNYFTMGVREKLDVVDWAKEIAARKPDVKIALFGWSMGGNTVMGAVGEALPENVRCAVADCGYDDLRTQLLFSCQKNMPRLPAKRFLIRLLGLYCRLFKGFSLNDPRSASLGRCKIPMFFIHGTADAVVPYANLDRCYEACAAKKQRATYQNVPHIRSCGSDPKRYFGELDAFIRKNTK